MNDVGQLYTLEGIIAGLIMLFAVYIAISTMGPPTVDDTWIADMRLEQLGNDVLMVLDTPDIEGEESRLVKLISTEVNGEGSLRSTLLEDNIRVKGQGDGSLQAQVFLSYRREDGSINTTPLPSLSDSELVGRKEGVRVTRWVHLDGRPPGVPPDMRKEGPCVVLVEVLLWRA